MREFTFLGSDVSIFWGYSLSQMLFLDRCICAALIFAIADVFVATIVSAIPWYSLSQMLSLGPMYLQLTFLWTCRYFSTCLPCTIASTSCLFWDLRILPFQILHLHPTFSITWRCFSLKLCILTLLFLCLVDTSHQNFASSIPEIHYRRYCHSISFEFHLLHKLSRYMTYKKIDIRNSSEYEMGAGDT